MTRTALMKLFLKEFGDKASLKKMFYLLIEFSLFLVIAAVCIQGVFSPVAVHINEIGGDETIIQNSALTLPGQILMAKSWTSYPNYMIPLCIAGFLAFCGMAFSVYSMHKVREKRIGQG